VLDIAIHKDFIKDIKRAKLNSTNLAKLFIYISLILNKEELPSQSRDHKLTGNYKDIGEFHISGDLLVLYRVEEHTLELLRVGTHAQLFR